MFWDFWSEAPYNTDERFLAHVSVTTRAIVDGECRGPTGGTTWSCEADHVSGQVAYAGEAGSVVVAPPGFQHKLRAPRPSHVVVSSNSLSAWSVPYFAFFWAKTSYGELEPKTK